MLPVPVRLSVVSYVAPFVIGTYSTHERKGRDGKPGKASRLELEYQEGTNRFANMAVRKLRAERRAKRAQDAAE